MEPLGPNYEYTFVTVKLKLQSMKARLNELLVKFKEFARTNENNNKPIITIYLDVDSTKEKNRKDNPAYKIELNNALKKVEETLDPEHFKKYEVQQEWSKFKLNLELQIYQHLQYYSGKSLLILSDLEEIFITDIQMPVETTLHYGTPRVDHLLYVLDKYKKYLVLVMSEMEVRAIELFLGRVSDETFIETNNRVKTRFGKKAKTLASDRRDLETEEAYARDLAEEINSYFMDDPDIDRLILAGNQKIAHNVKSKLHPLVEDQVVSILRMDIKAKEPDISKIVAEISNQFEEEKDIIEIKDLVSIHNSQGLGVLELNDVKSALTDGRVKKLMVSYPFVDTEKIKLVYEAFLNGVNINFVFGKAKEKLDKLGGIGAYLYYGFKLE